MGLLLEKLGLKPTTAMTAGAGANTPPTATKPDARPKSPEMASLITRFQEVMGRIKALEADKVPGAAALKLATIAAGNLSTSPKGIVAANAALDTVVKQIADLKAKLDKAAAGKGGADEAAPQADGKKLADEARKRLKALEARGQKAIAANPRNPNAGWLAEVVANSEGRFASLEKHGTEPYIGNVQKHLDWLEDSVKRFEADAAEGASSGGGPAQGGGASAKDEAPPDGVVPDAGKLAARERKRLKALETRGRKAIAADPRQPERRLADRGGRRLRRPHRRARIRGHPAPSRRREEAARLAEGEHPPLRGRRQAQGRRGVGQKTAGRRFAGAEEGQGAIPAGDGRDPQAGRGQEPPGGVARESRGGRRQPGHQPQGHRGGDEGARRGDGRRRQGQGGGRQGQGRGGQGPRGCGQGEAGSEEGQGRRRQGRGGSRRGTSGAGKTARPGRPSTSPSPARSSRAWAATRR